MAIEEPKFHSVLKDGPFEIRDYAPSIVAEVTVTGGQKEAARKGFRLLAAYIFGGNRGKQGIAMTAPVTQAPAAEVIAMTAPVTQMEISESWLVQFTMPGRYTLASLPQPSDERVKLRPVPPARFAVIRFSGLARPGDVAKHTAELRAWMEQRQLQSVGVARLAQYNPPWTPWFMRRNEVLIAVADRSSGAAAGH